MPTTFYGLVKQNGPWSTTPVDKQRLREKDVPILGGGNPAGGTLHAGHANWLMAVAYPNLSDASSSNTNVDFTTYPSVLSTPRDVKTTLGYLGYRGRAKQYYKGLVPGQAPPPPGQRVQMTAPPAPGAGAGPGAPPTQPGQLQPLPTQPQPYTTNVPFPSGTAPDMSAPQPDIEMEDVTNIFTPGPQRVDQGVVQPKRGPSLSKLDTQNLPPSEPQPPSVPLPTLGKRKAEDQGGPARKAVTKPGEPSASQPVKRRASASDQERARKQVAYEDIAPGLKSDTKKDAEVQQEDKNVESKMPGAWPTSSAVGTSAPSSSGAPAVSNTQSQADTTAQPINVQLPKGSGKGSGTRTGSKKQLGPASLFTRPSIAERRANTPFSPISLTAPTGVLADQQATDQVQALNQDMGLPQASTSGFTTSTTQRPFSAMRDIKKGKQKQKALEQETGAIKRQTSAYGRKKQKIGPGLKTKTKGSAPPVSPTLSRKVKTEVKKEEKKKEEKKSKRGPKPPPIQTGPGLGHAALVAASPVTPVSATSPGGAERKVMNPLTGKRIKVGSKAYKDLVSKGVLKPYQARAQAPMDRRERQRRARRQQPY